MKRFEITNKKASFNYEFKDTYVAGIVLNGSEISAIRDGCVNISESYCFFVGNELFLKNSIVTPKREHDTYKAKDYNRDRKLLLNKSELKKIYEQVKIKGMTVVPYKLFINERNMCKVVVAIASGKKTYDKRRDIKERDIDRQSKREL